MAYAVNNTITRADIINKFNEAVISRITADTYDITNPPMDGGYQCVPSNLMDAISNIPTPTVGVVGQKISASSLVNALIDVTRNLTRVGTFSYRRKYHETFTVNIGPMYYQGTLYQQGDVVYDTNNVVATKSGKVLYKESKIVNLASIPTTNIVAGQPIKIADINALCEACYNSWNSTSKYSQSFLNETCHSVCHSNCHQDCHDDCHSACYAD